MLKSPTKPVGGSAALLAACRAGSIQTVDLLVAQATHALAKAATPGLVGSQPYSSRSDAVSQGVQSR